MPVGLQFPLRRYRIRRDRRTHARYKLPNPTVYTSAACEPAPMVDPTGVNYSKGLRRRSASGPHADSQRPFADPSGFDRSGKRPETGIGRKIGHVIFLLAGRMALADEPDFFVRHALHAALGHAVLMAVRDADASGGEEAGQAPLRTASPVDPSPRLIGQSSLGGVRQLIWNAVLARPACLGVVATSRSSSVSVAAPAQHTSLRDAAAADPDFGRR